VKIVYSEEFETLAKAKKREAQVKSLSKTEKEQILLIDK